MTAPNRTLLSDRDRLQRLADLDGWTDADGFIRRAFTFADFREAMRFINAVADVAEALDHHPNLENVYNRVTLRLQTHDAGGVTETDFAFAEAVNALPITGSG